MSLGDHYICLLVNIDFIFVYIYFLFPFFWKLACAAVEKTVCDAELLEANIGIFSSLSNIKRS